MVVEPSTSSPPRGQLTESAGGNVDSVSARSAGSSPFRTANKPTIPFGMVGFVYLLTLLGAIPNSFLNIRVKLCGYSKPSASDTSETELPFRSKDSAFCIR